MKNLFFFILQNEQHGIERMNIAFQEIAYQNGIRLEVGDDYDVVHSIPEDIFENEIEPRQGVEIGEEFVETMNLFETTLKPSYEELHMEMQSVSGYHEVELLLVSPTATYKGKVFYDNLQSRSGLTTSYWMDMNKLELL